MKGRLLTKGNIAVFEYPSGVTEPEFTLDKNDGVLFIFGYVAPYRGQIIRVAKRFETGLINYRVVGRYDDAKFEIKGNFSELLFGLNEHFCLVMIKEPNDN